MGTNHPTGHCWVTPGFSDQVQVQFLPLAYPVYPSPYNGC